VPSAADGELLTDTFYFLRKLPTLLRDSVPSPCAAVVTVAPNIMIYHGTLDTPGSINPNGAFFSMPASAVAINGVPCTAPANVVFWTSYYEDGDARVSMEALANFETLICGAWGAISLEWFVTPSRRIAWLSFQKLVCDESDWSCQHEILWFDLSLRRRYECEMTRPLCRGGDLNYTGPPQTAGPADHDAGVRAPKCACLLVGRRRAKHTARGDRRRAGARGEGAVSTPAGAGVHGGGGGARRGDVASSAWCLNLDRNGDRRDGHDPKGDPLLALHARGMCLEFDSESTCSRGGQTCPSAPTFQKCPHGPRPRRATSTRV